MEAVINRVAKYRESLRSSGLRPVQIWVPDTRTENFSNECQRQCLLAAQSDKTDRELANLMEIAVNEIEGWSE